MNDKGSESSPIWTETPMNSGEGGDIHKNDLEKLQEDYDLLMKEYLEAKQKVKNLTTALKNIAAAM